jgi:hypothetical protein
MVNDGSCEHELHLDGSTSSSDQVSFPSVQETHQAINEGLQLNLGQFFYRQGQSKVLDRKFFNAGMGCALGLLPDHCGNIGWEICCPLSYLF